VRRVLFQRRFSSCPVSDRAPFDKREASAVVRRVSDFLLFLFYFILFFFTVIFYDFKNDGLR